MKKVIINNFKGIPGPLEINFTKNEISQANDLQNLMTQNVLIYAENGGGKSSVAEALRVAFFSNELHSREIAPNIIGEEKIEAIKSLWRSFLFDSSRDYFSIIIDDYEFTMGRDHNFINKDVAILCRHDLLPTSKIDLLKIINSTNVKCKESLINLLNNENIFLVIEEANSILKEYFKEQFKLIRLQESGVFIGIEGLLKNENIGENIDKKVNEATQNLIKTILFFSFLKLIVSKNNNEDKLIVILDDIMSSLDLSNRIILARYIAEMGRFYQMLVLTHNVGFYNLLKHVASVEGLSHEWKTGSLYFDKGKHELLFDEDQDYDTKKILKKYENKIQPNNYEALNSLRKRLEYLLHEFGKILILGTQEETKDLIEKLVTAKNIYCCVQGDKIKTLQDLIHEIENLIKIIQDGNMLRDKIRMKISQYRDSNIMPMVAQTLRHLHVYQKVVLHPGSHDNNNSILPVSNKEITLTIELLKSLESIISRPSTQYPSFL